MTIQRKHVIQTALKLLDEGGIEGVTLRKLAQVLEIQAPSLYWHFANKQALIDAMADALLEDVARDIPENGDWRATLHQVAAQIRQALNARRDGARVFAGTYVSTDNVLRTGETIIAAFVRAGADIELAATSAFSVLYYVLGFAIEEQALGSERLAGGDARKEAFLQLAQEKYPCSWRARDLLLAPAFDRRFETGLDLLLDGVRQRLPATGQTGMTGATSATTTITANGK